MKLSMFTAALVAGIAFAGAVCAQPANPMQAVRTACTADFQKYCPDAKPGPGGGIRECVVAHHADFSQQCMSAIMAARQARQQQGGGAAPQH
jgi:hypothetical protein